MNRLIDYSEKVIIILFALPFFIAFKEVASTEPRYLAVAATEFLSVLFVLIRKPGQIAQAPYAVAIAFVGTMGPLLARPTGGVEILPEAVTSTLMFGGLIISLLAKLCLNRSFGIVAANRGVKSGGIYRLVRHPMYLGYMVTQAGLLLSVFSFKLLVIYSLVWVAQVLRIREEEKFLMVDADYRNFASRTSYRLLPGLY